MVVSFGCMYTIMNVLIKSVNYAFAKWTSLLDGDNQIGVSYFETPGPIEAMRLKRRMKSHPQFHPYTNY